MPNIARKRLGRTDLQVPHVGLGGAWLMGRQHTNSLESGTAIVRHALAHDIDYVDTAECYGESELAVGMALEGYTGNCILATKFGHVPHDFDFSRQSVLESVQRSRERLRYRPIDLLQLHTPSEPAWEQVFGPGGAIEGMREAQQRGWCRFLGTTGNNVEFLRRCLDTDVFDTMLVFLRYDLLDQSGEELIKAASARDVGVILGSPLRMGLFGSARAESLPGITEAEKARLAELDVLFAAEPGGSTAGALRFALSCPQAAMVLTGAGSLAELDETLETIRAPLRPDLAESVRRIFQE